MKPAKVVERGKVRVKRSLTHETQGVDVVNFPDFTPIVVLTKSSAYGAIGPYVLRDDKGRILENVWQGSKVYEKVPQICDRNRHNGTLVWEHGEETHVEFDCDTKKFSVTKDYLAWRNKLMNWRVPVRYPVGYHHRHTCLFAMKEDDGGRIVPKTLGYVNSRKHIYVPIYDKAVRKAPLFHKLKERLNLGENLMIIEVDGPHEESLDYYKKNYDVGDDFIVGSSIEASHRNLEIMINDTLHPYGHGYCLAAALLDINVHSQ